MYTRNFSRISRYSPPPGYVGNAFAVAEEGKHHQPQDELRQQDNHRTGNQLPEPSSHQTKPEVRPELRNAPVQEEAQSEKPIQPVGGELTQLLQHLRGRLGKEELILLTVMLLIASDGLRPEVIILALMLFVH